MANNTGTIQARTLHPLRAALLSAQQRYELELEDETIEQTSARWAETCEALEAARAALAGSDCPREWQLSEDDLSYMTIEASSLEEALAEARRGAHRSHDGTATSTIWVDVRVVCAETGEEEDETVTIDPEPPPCREESEHSWSDDYDLVGGCRQSPGVWGNGGGVILVYGCVHCGCRRVTDTWAQRPDTGEQGLTSVEYYPGYWTEEELEAAGY